MAIASIYAPEIPHAWCANAGRRVFTAVPDVSGPLCVCGGLGLRTPSEARADSATWQVGVKARVLPPPWSRGSLMPSLCPSRLGRRQLHRENFCSRPTPQTTDLEMCPTGMHSGAPGRSDNLRLALPSLPPTLTQCLLSVGGA